MTNLIKAAVSCAIGLGGLYVLSTQGRTGHPGLEKLKQFHYAHRGLHNESRPENSLSAFRAALDAGYGIELDIHLMADGNLAVIHDCSLKRTAGVDVKITDLTTETLSAYSLLGSGEPIPLFSQVLELYAGKAPLIIELKADGNNHKELVRAAVAAMAGYEGPYCMESFDPRCVYELKKHHPHIIRGQLTENYFSGKNALPLPLKWALTNQALNFLTRPDFVAYRWQDHKNSSNLLARKFWGIAGVTWTLRSKEDFGEAVKDGWIPIFENFIP